jgi:transposase-like protein
MLKLHLVERTPVSDICDRHGIQPTQFYTWQKQFFENAPAVFERKNGSTSATHQRTIEALQAKLQRKNEVLAELLEEHVQLKKELGEL